MDKQPPKPQPPADAPREECTPAGIQLLIPGVPPIERKTKGGGAQMSLF